MSELAPMREQVYTDPRPKEYFDRFHERARTREPDWVYDFVRVLTSLYAYTLLRARALAVENVPGERRGDPRAEPLLVHGPLPDGLLHPPQGALHGQVAAVQAADAVDLHARRRLPGPPRRARRRRVHHRARRSSRAAGRSRCTARGGARARANSPSRPSAGSGAWRWRRARRSCRSRSTAPRACATGSACSSRRSPIQYGEPMRWEPVEDPTREQQQAGRRRGPRGDPPALRRPGGARAQGDRCAGCASSARRGRRSGGRGRRVMAGRLDVGGVIRRVWPIYVDQAPVLMPAAAVVFVFTGILRAARSPARAAAFVLAR